jgi:hypothetical protein
MTLNQSWVSRAARTLKMSFAGVALLATAGGLTAGCLDRPVAPAKPRTSNVVVKTVTQSGVDKIDLVFMIDNSISMADKQEILAQAVPVLVQRLVDPVCVDPDGNPTQGTVSSGCGGGSTPEFKPIQNIHIGIVTSSLGDHGGEVCVPNPADMPPRTLNDSAQLVASVRSGVYSYSNQGFLVWDPRQMRPTPDPHPGLSNHERNATDFVADFAAHVAATGERGCGYEASLEAWYRFLIDPQPINQVTIVNNVNARGPINQVVLQQRAAFLRPDSLLAIVMLTDENDCSINDEDGVQGWLVGRRVAMPRGSDACADPGSPNYKCCIPCVLLDDPNFSKEGCSYANDASCGVSHSLPMAEDSTNLRCYQQVRRFGLDLLYPWQRYVDGLKLPRVRLRPTADNPAGGEVPNPLYTPGADGTPARSSDLVFLAGIIGVPWQDIASADSLGQNRGLRYLTASEMAAPRDPAGNPFGPNRWDVILGNPDTGQPPSDPFMIESIDQRAAGLTNPIPGVQAAITAAAPGNTGNTINGHEQNIMNRDDLQYACTFDLQDPVLCTTANQDGCDCNASEEGYNRPLCQYPGGGGDGTQTDAKAYPGVRHLQVLKGFGNNAIVASICPKNVQAQGSAAEDAAYGYNPAVAAIIERLKEALVATCLPRPLAVEEAGVPCIVVESFQPGADGSCSCTNMPGRADLTDENKGVIPAVHEELRAGSLCGGKSGVSCASYCMCEIEQFSGDQLNACRTIDPDPGNAQYGYCYVKEGQDGANPTLTADCPDTQTQIIRFMGNDVPRPRALAFIACLGDAVQGAADAGM